jgi:hypothetical protein
MEVNPAFDFSGRESDKTTSIIEPQSADVQFLGNLGGGTVVYGIDANRFCALDVGGNVVDKKHLLRTAAGKFGGGVKRGGLGLNRPDAITQGMYVKTFIDKTVMLTAIPPVTFAGVR